MNAALRDAGLPAREIGHISAHGTATQAGDAAEAASLGRVFGEGTVPVTPTKAITGHLLEWVETSNSRPSGAAVLAAPDRVADVGRATPQPFYMTSTHVYAAARSRHVALNRVPLPGERPPSGRRLLRRSAARLAAVCSPTLKGTVHANHTQ
jgi:hypothetical protein